ncbi:VanZ family protein [Luteimonas fraxinea]|uniref:VanZ family protein n=1 Tax=Luteimonas fraxinea TaxID=2901869 RepID=A0ABS8UEQ7_9GAMM|nr:VanZ family protein [Luteimonas fraxinea]MCD9097226.1 VanZ family protein [Luteimonas fraxinea]MCD9125209.1 VanZ family protein [Luteimonas fraxinea]UHH11492.1 VanZ family protein [Luteimonas fraxinea]
MNRRPRFGRSFKPLRRPVLWGGLWIAAIAAVVVLSLAPSVPMPDVPDGDKLGHFLAYFALAAAAVQLYARWPALLGAGVGLVLLGIGLEYAQGALTQTRMQDSADAFANTLGVIVGLSTRLTPFRDVLLQFDTRGLEGVGR